MIDGETGILLDPDPSPEELARAVRHIAEIPDGSFRDACLKQSHTFTLPVFAEKLRGLVE